MEKIVSTVLLLGIISSISCTSFATGFQDSIIQETYRKPDCHFQLQNLNNIPNENKCNSFISTIKDSINLMKKNTGLDLTSNATIEVYRNGTLGSKLIEEEYGGGAYLPLGDKIFLSENELVNGQAKTLAHEITHAELCNRLKTCKKTSLFSYKHSISFEEGITSQNNLGVYDRNSQDVIKTQHTLCNQAANKENCYEKMDQLLDSVYKEDFKRKLIFAPITKGGGASYLVHQELISKWIEEKGLNVIEDMINAVNEKNIFPEEYFLQNGGEQIILGQYGEKGLTYAKRNIRSLKIRSLSKYALIPLLAFIIDREIRADVNSIKLVTKLPKTTYAKLKPKFIKKDNANLKVASQQCNKIADQKTEEVFNENPADLSNSNVDEDSNFGNNNLSAEKACTSEEVLSENPAGLSDSNVAEDSNLENNNLSAEKACTSEEVLSENPAGLSDSNLEKSVNAVADNKSSCKQLFKNVVKYRIHEILLAVTTVVLYKYCQQTI